MLATVEDGRLVGQRSLFSVAGYDTFGNVPPYDVSPDGEEFLFVRSGGTTSPIVVLNWLSEVERLLEGGS